MEFVTASDLAYLLRYRFLDVLLLDLRQAVKSETGVENRVLNGSFPMPNFAQQLTQSPNLGSAIYAITLNNTLRCLITTLRCPILVVADECGLETGVAQRFVQTMKEVDKVTGQRQKYAQFILYLQGGFEALYRDYPGLFSGPGNDSNKRGADDEYVPQKVAHVNPYALPDDPPSEVIPDFLYLGGIQSTSRHHITRLGIHVVLSLGEVPLVIDPMQKGHVTGPGGVIDDGQGTYRSLVEPLELGTELSSPFSTASSQAGSMPQTPARKFMSLKARVPVTSNVVNLFSAEDSVRLLHSFAYHHFDIEDVSHAPIETLFSTTSKILSQAQARGQKVLVHCFGGVSRSASVVVAFLMTKYRRRDNRGGMSSGGPVVKLRQGPLGTMQSVPIVASPLYSEASSDEYSSSSGGTQSTGGSRQSARVTPLTSPKQKLPRGPMSLAEAFAQVFYARPWVKPNDGFWQKLHQLETEERVVRAVRRLVIAATPIPTSSGSSRSVGVEGGILSRSVSMQQFRSNPVSPSYSDIDEEDEDEVPRFQSDSMRRLSATDESAPSPLGTSVLVSADSAVDQNSQQPSERPKPNQLDLINTALPSSSRRQGLPRRSQHQKPDLHLFSPYLSSSTYWDFGKKYERSDRVVSIEDALGLGSLCARVMACMRKDRIVKWFDLRRMLDSDDVCS